MGSIPSLRAEILLRHHVGRERPLDQIGIQWGPGPPWLVCHKLTITSLATPRLTITSYRVDWGPSIKYVIKRCEQQKNAVLLVCEPVKYVKLKKP